MWAFLSRRFRTWLLFAVGVPIIAWTLGRVGEALEARTGETGLTRGLARGRSLLERRTRGPARRRLRRA